MERRLNQCNANVKCLNYALKRSSKLILLALALNVVAATEIRKQL